MTGNQRKLGVCDIGNQECAEIILGDIARYGGEGALPVLWARMILGRAERTAPAIVEAA